MLVVQENKYAVNWHIGADVKPLMYRGDLVVVIDPSKTNTAMAFATPTGDVLNILEFSGNNRRRGPVQDTTVFCNELRQYLRQYLVNANLYCVAVEQAITKKGQNYHRSSMVLTEIRGNILNFFLEVFNIKVLEVNNWAWKSHVLPQGYRSQSEKGSKRYFHDYFPDSDINDYFEADVTDVLCILQYVLDTQCSGYSCVCNRVEPALDSYKYFYTSTSNPYIKGQVVKYNPMFSIKENLDFYANRYLTSFSMDVPVEDVDANDVYGKCIVFNWDNLKDETVKVVVSSR